VLVQLNAAKHEDSRKITEEKIHVIQKDFSEWATNFVRNLPRIKSEFAKTKSDFEHGQLQAQIDAGRKEIQVSQEAFPVISFAVRFVQETVRAFGKHAGKEVKIDSADLPENFYEKQSEYLIRFSEKAGWKLSVSARRPAGESPASAPVMRVVFSDSRGAESGNLLLRVEPAAKKFRVTYRAAIPSPDPSKINGERDLSDYETSIRELLQPILDVQLLQAVD